MKLNLLHVPLSFEHAMDLSFVKLWGDFPFKEPVLLKGEVARNMGAYTISYTADYSYRARCSRCLSEIAEEHHRQYGHTILAKDESEHVTAPNGILDLDELAITDILLEHADIPLCGKDCAIIS